MKSSIFPVLVFLFMTSVNTYADVNCVVEVSPKIYAATMLRGPEGDNAAVIAASILCGNRTLVDNTKIQCVAIAATEIYSKTFIRGPEGDRTAVVAAANVCR